MQYFFADGDQQKGPFPLESLCAQGLKRDSLVWREGMAQWQTAESLAELASVIGARQDGTQAPESSPLPNAQAGAMSPAPARAPAFQPAQTNSPLAYQQPGYYEGYGAMPPSNGMAVASMVVGIISIPMTFMYCFGLPCAVIAIILGHIARGKARRDQAPGAGMALAGLICGYVSVLLAVGMIAIFLCFIGYSASHAH